MVVALTYGGAMAQRGCPACDVQMASGQMGPARVDVCVRCGGTWLEEGALPALAQGGPQALKTLCEKVRALRQPAAGHETHAPRCPGCQVPLVATEFGSMPGIRLYACSFCKGFWLDTGTLTGILARLTPPTPQPGAGTREVTPAPAATPTTAAPAAATPARQAPRPGGGPQFTPPPASIWSGKANAPAVKPAAAKPASGSGPIVEREACPSCGEKNPKSAPVCWACGHMLQARVVGHCPRCTAGMSNTETEGIHVTACQACGGTLLDDKRLTALLGLPEHYQQRLLDQIQKQQTGRAVRHLDVMRCEHCRVNLVDAPLGMMTREPVFVCPSCQLFFMDGGVLGRVLWAR